MEAQGRYTQNIQDRFNDNLKKDNANIAVVSFSPAVDDEEADFEKAIEESGHGKFNYLLLLVAVPATWCSVFDTMNTSFLLPAAECDLNLSHFDKGLLNAVVYVGMVLSAFSWGFISDTCGRHRLLVLGYFLDAVCNLAASFAQSFWLLLVLKCLGGIIICGPMVVLMSYLAEFQGVTRRAKVMMWTGVSMASAQIILPAIAWCIIPQTWQLRWTWFGMALTFNSWRLFLVVCAIPAIIASSLLYFFFDESPKYLMACGRTEDALRVFRKIYTMNTGKPSNTYSVKRLVDETRGGSGVLTSAKWISKSPLAILKMGSQQAKPLFNFPLLPRALLVFTLQFGALLGMNTLRLWLPQIFATMEEFLLYHQEMNITVGGDSLCEMLYFNHSLVANPVVKEVATCSASMLENAVYVNSMVVGAITAVCIMCASYLVNWLGKKNILISAFMLGGVSGVCIFWARSTIATLILSSLYVGMCGICATAVVGVVVDLFPTSLRSMTLALTMMAGELGASIGNLLFPVLLDISCIMPFFLLGGIVLFCSALSLSLPVSNKTPLQ